MKLLTLIIVAGLFGPLRSADTWASWPQIKKAGVIRVATEGSFRPFNYIEDKTFSGFEVELVNAIAKKLGLKPEWSAHTFESLLGGLSQHSYDLVAGSHAITPERAKAVEFINPHYCTGAVIVTKAGTKGSLKALTGHILGVSVGTTYADRFKAMPRFKEIKVFADDKQAIEALSAGQIDAWVTDRFVGAALLKAKPGANFDLGQMLFPEMIAMAVAKDERELKDKINGALAALVKDGTYLALSRRYFNQDIGCQAHSGHRRTSRMGE